MADYSEKPFLAIDQMVALLTDKRNLNCADKPSLEEFLKKNNYYRFSGYTRHWQKDPRHGDNVFVEGTSFEKITQMIERDQILRQLLLEQISHIEISVKSLYAYELAKKYGNKAFYLNADNYDDSSIPELLLVDISRSKSKMIERYAEISLAGTRDFSKLPIWVAVEVLSLGKISKMIENFKDIEPAKCATQDLSIQWQPFASNMHAITILRNQCAHHSQLWHRPQNFVAKMRKRIIKRR